MVEAEEQKMKEREEELRARDQKAAKSQKKSLEEPEGGEHRKTDGAVRPKTQP